MRKARQQRGAPVVAADLLDPRHVDIARRLIESRYRGRGSELERGRLVRRSSVNRVDAVDVGRVVEKAGDDLGDDLNLGWLARDVLLEVKGDDDGLVPARGVGHRVGLLDEEQLSGSNVLRCDDPSTSAARLDPFDSNRTNKVGYVESSLLRRLEPSAEQSDPVVVTRPRFVQSRLHPLESCDRLLVRRRMLERFLESLLGPSKVPQALERLCRPNKCFLL